MQNTRIHQIDAIRGFAIIGIILVNIYSFSWPELYDSFPSSYWNTPIDHFTQWILFIFVQSNFYPLFSLLFGISMGFIFKNAINRGLNPYIIFSKRLLFLLLIGAIHAFFIWYGDILIVYAVFGFLLLPLCTTNKESLAFLGFSMLLIPNIIYAGILFITDSSLVQTNNQTIIQEVLNQYKNGYIHFLSQNLHDWLLIYQPSNIPFIFISIFPMFLLGLGVAKSEILTKITEESLKKNTLCLIAGVLGLAFKILPLLKPGYLLYLHLATAFGGPLMSLFYALIIAKYATRFNRINTTLISVGRMSMTNYLLQSLIGLLVYKGFGFYGLRSPMENLFIALLIVIAQVIFSKQWLNSHRYGPIESIWRMVTFGMIRRDKEKSVEM